MGNTIDLKMRTEMIKAMEGAMAYHEKLRKNHEIQLWKNAGAPCSLHGALSRLTKTELDEIRKNHEFRNISALNKADLVSELSVMIPPALKNVLYTMDLERFELINKIMGQSGVVSYEELSSSQREELKKFGILYYGKQHGEKILFIPEDLLAFFRRLDLNALENILHRNTEWILLTQGLLYYLGVIRLFELMEKIRSLTKQEVDPLAFIKVIRSASGYYSEIHTSSTECRHKNAHDTVKILREQKKRDDVSAAAFTKTQLRKAGKSGYVEKTTEMKNLISFLREHYTFPSSVPDEMAAEINRIINVDGDPILVMKYLESILELPTFEFVQNLTVRIMELYNNSRQWDLKGHTPMELRHKNNTHLKPVISQPFSMKTTSSVTVENPQPVKIGRNDPCPCGSGKKYKKCCGRF